MATYHLTMKIAGVGRAKLHYSYICREGKYSTGDKAEELSYKENGNMPSWAKENPALFWDSADRHERVNGRTYREIEIALPNELTREQQKSLVKDFVNKHIGKNHPYSFAIHEKQASFEEGVMQPHAHIMFSERKLDGVERNQELFFSRAYAKNPEQGGAKKDRSWISQRRLEDLRKSWADMQNRDLEKYGHDRRVDHRTLAEQRKEALERKDYQKADELDREPERHLGPKASRARKDLIKEYRTVNEEIREVRKMIDSEKTVYHEHHHKHNHQSKSKDLLESAFDDIGGGLESLFDQIADRIERKIKDVYEDLKQYRNDIDKKDMELADLRDKEKDPEARAAITQDRKELMQERGKITELCTALEDSRIWDRNITIQGKDTVRSIIDQSEHVKEQLAEIKREIGLERGGLER